MLQNWENKRNIKKKNIQNLEIQTWLLSIRYMPFQDIPPLYVLNNACYVNYTYSLK